MTHKQFEIFDSFRKEFKAKVQEWNELIPNLCELQKIVAEKTNTPNYPIETPIVYNTSLDDFTMEDEIRLIVIADNPGKDEQLRKNNKYLVGQAGKIAQGYFERNKELEINFRKNVIILNKTPIHSAKTAHLKMISELGGEKVVELIKDSQIWMAKKTAELHQNLCKVDDVEFFSTSENYPCCDKKSPKLWLVGYSELKPKGLFELYRETLKNSYKSNEQMNDFWDEVFVFQHFSMNRFICDFKKFVNDDENKKSQSLEKNLRELGILHKKEIFGE